MHGIMRDFNDTLCDASWTEQSPYLQLFFSRYSKMRVVPSAYTINQLLVVVLADTGYTDICETLCSQKRKYSADICMSILV